VSFALGLSWLNGIGSPSFYSTVTVDQPAKPGGRPARARQGGYHRIQQSDVVLFVGTNPLHRSDRGSSCPAQRAVALRAEVQRGRDVIVIDPRRTETAQHAAIHLAVTPGEDPTLLAGMVRLIIAEELYDRAFVAEHGSRLEELRAAVEPFTLDYVERRAGVPADAVAAAAHGCARPRSARRGTVRTWRLTCCRPRCSSARSTRCAGARRAGDEVNHAGVLGAGYQPREGALPPRVLGVPRAAAVRGLRTLNWEQPSAALCDEILTPGDGQVRALISQRREPRGRAPGAGEGRAGTESSTCSCASTCTSARPRAWPTTCSAASSRSRSPTTPATSSGTSRCRSAVHPAIIEAEGDVIDEWELFWGLAHRMRARSSSDAPLGPPVANLRPVDIDTKPTTDELMEIEAADARVPLAEVKRYPSGHVFERRADHRRPTADARFDLAPSCSSRTSAGSPRNPSSTAAATARRALHPPARQPPPAPGVQLDRHAPAGPQPARPGNPAYLGPDDMRAAAWPTATGWRSRPSTGTSSAWRGLIRRAAGGGLHGPRLGLLPGDADGALEAGACTNRLVANDVDFEPLIGQARQSAIPVNLRPLTLREESAQ
jgi:anaerobic selenocysteine-containing dehydrogenase